MPVWKVFNNDWMLNLRNILLNVGLHMAWNFKVNEWIETFNIFYTKKNTFFVLYVSFFYLGSEHMEPEFQFNNCWAFSIFSLKTLQENILIPNFILSFFNEAHHISTNMFFVQKRERKRLPFGKLHLSWMLQIKVWPFIQAQKPVIYVLNIILQTRGWIKD